MNRKNLTDYWGSKDCNNALPESIAGDLSQKFLKLKWDSLQLERITILILWVTLGENREQWAFRRITILNFVNIIIVAKALRMPYLQYSAEILTIDYAMIIVDFCDCVNCITTSFLSTSNCNLVGCWKVLLIWACFKKEAGV